MLRDAVKAGSSLGIKAQGFMDKGNLVPDQLILGLIGERIQQEDCKQGYILDGFPRTLDQAVALEGILSGKGQQLEKVIFLDIQPSSVVDRLIGRRVCAECGTEYHIVNFPPQLEGKCDQCGGGLLQRPDDDAEKIRVRLESYAQQTAPIANFYRDLGILAHVAAEGDIDVITEKILAILSS